MSIIKALHNSQTVGTLYNPKENSFHLMRFLLATGVIYSHSYALLEGTKGKGELFAYFTKGQALLSTLSVNGFFVVSGFLVTQSLINSSTVKSFMAKRILRLMPALFVSLFVSAFIMGPLVSKLPLHDYFSFGPNGPLDFLLKNITFGIRGDVWGIQDVFAQNPNPNTVNGSIWTLKYEIALYIGLGLTQIFGFSSKKKQISFAFVIICVLVALNYIYGIQFVKSTSLNLWVLNLWNQNFFISLAFYFLSGGIFYLFRDKIPMNKVLVSCILLGLLISNQTMLLKYGLLLFFPYLIVSASINKKFFSFGRFGDFSYGLYIYAFPIQQLISFLFQKHLTVGSFFLTSFIATLAVSIISWKFIEEPILSLKHKFFSVSIDKQLIGPQAQNY